MRLTLNSVINILINLPFLIVVFFHDIILNRLVGIVTSASTKLGAQTCRTLLRYNALVLGIDESPVTEEEHRLFSQVGTHFQTLQLSLKEDDVVPRMLAHCKERFWKEGLDFVITFGEDGSAELRSSLAGNLREGDGGAIVDVLKSGSLYQSADVIELNKQRKTTSIRPSIVKLEGSAAGNSGWKMLEAPEDAIGEVKECVDRFRGLKQEDVDTFEGDRAVADLFLYLVSELGRDVSGEVTADGGWKSF